MSPKIMSGKDTSEQTENFLKKYNSIEGTRLPGDRRHKKIGKTLDQEESIVI